MSADEFLVPCEANEVCGPAQRTQWKIAAVALQRGNVMTLYKHSARSTLPLIALALAAVIAAPARAQEEPSTPGQIPDPGTYQGSQVLQQQSDQQDQQFRQQQQQQYAPQNGGQYSGGNYGSRSSGQATPPSV